MTFQAWKMVLVNSMTFHDFPGGVVTLSDVQQVPQPNDLHRNMMWCLILAHWPHAMKM